MALTGIAYFKSPAFFDSSQDEYDVSCDGAISSPPSGQPGVWSSCYLLIDVNTGDPLVYVIKADDLGNPAIYPDLAAVGPGTTLLGTDFASAKAALAADPQFGPALAQFMGDPPIRTAQPVAAGPEHRVAHSGKKVRVRSA